MYLFVFQSGYNKGTPDTYDVFAEIEEKGLMSRLSNYCKKKSENKVWDCCVGTC